MILDKELYVKKTDWNTTNLAEVNWIQRGNVVQVHCQTISGFATGATAITGLPKPFLNTAGTFAHSLASGDAIHPVGYISYNVATYGWGIYIPTDVATPSFFCDFTYLTDE